MATRSKPNITLDALRGALKWLEGIRGISRDVLKDGQPSDFGLNRLRDAIALESAAPDLLTELSYIDGVAPDDAGLLVITVKGLRDIRAAIAKATVKTDKGLDRIATAFEEARQTACNRWVLRYGEHLRTTERTAWNQGFEAAWHAAVERWIGGAGLAVGFGPCPDENRRCDVVHRHGERALTDMRTVNEAPGDSTCLACTTGTLAGPIPGVLSNGEKCDTCDIYPTDAAASAAVAKATEERKPCRGTS